MASDRPTGGMTRRQMIGASAAGAAAIWAAPAVTTIGLAPAAAASATGVCPIPEITPFEGETNFVFAGQLPAGADLTQNDASPWSNDTTGFIFLESGPIQIPPGGYDSETGAIPGGTWVCSIYMHSSSVSGTFRYRGTISVPGSTVLGYDGRTNRLQNSDPLFAVPGVNYNGAARGHEFGGNPNGNGDYYGLIAPDTVEIRTAVADCCTDQGRIFVACI